MPINKHIFIEKGLKNILLSQKQYIFLSAWQLLNMAKDYAYFTRYPLWRQNYYFPKKKQQQKTNKWKRWTHKTQIEWNNQKIDQNSLPLPVLTLRPWICATPFSLQVLELHSNWLHRREKKAKSFLLILQMDQLRPAKFLVSIIKKKLWEANIRLQVSPWHIF